MVGATAMPRKAIGALLPPSPAARHLGRSLELIPNRMVEPAIHKRRRRSSAHQPASPCVMALLTSKKQFWNTCSKTVRRYGTVLQQRGESHKMLTARPCWRQAALCTGDARGLSAVVYAGPSRPLVTK